MTAPSLIDQLFLKASELSGRERIAFLRTLPADIRGKVSALLAADESVANRDFLGDGFHGEPSRQSNDRRPKKKSGDGSPNRQRRASGKTAAKPSSRPKKVTRSTDAARERNRLSELPKHPMKKKQSRKKQQGSKGYWLAGIGAVSACSLLVWLIVSALQRTEMDVAHSEPTEVTPEAMEIETSPPVEEVQPEPTVESRTPAASEEPLFFTPAVTAPPLTPQKLDLLPKALTSISLVTNPRPLSGVRSWTVETVDTRSYQGPISLSRDGQWLASASQDGNIRIINYHTGQLTKIIVLETDNASSLHWGASNEHLFVCSHVWNPQRHIIRRFHVPSARVTHRFQNTGHKFSLTADRSQIYAISEHQLVVLNAPDLSVAETLPFAEEFDGVNLSPAGDYLLASGGNSVSIYKNSRPLEELKRVDRNCGQTAHAWSSRGQIATGWGDGQVIIHDAKIAGVPEVAAVQMFADKRFASCYAWLSDDVALANGGGNDIGWIDVKRREVAKRVGSGLWHSKLCYSTELQIGAVAGDGQITRLARGEVGEILSKATGTAPNSISISSDGRYLAALARYSEPSCFDLSTGQRIVLVNDEVDPSIEEVVWSTNNQLLCRSGSKVTTSSKRGLDNVVTSRFDLGQRQISQMIWAENNASSLIRCDDGSVMLCRTGADAAKRLPVPDIDPILAIAWNEKRKVAVLVAQKNVHEWNPETDIVRAVAKTPAGCTADVELNSDGSRIAFCGVNVVILDAADYSEVARHEWKDTSIRWLSDGDLMVLEQGGWRMRKISLNHPEEPAKVRLAFDKYAAWTVSPTAPVAAATIKGNFIRLVDTRNGAHLGTIVPIDGTDHGIISPEGAIIGASPGFRNRIVYQLKTDAGQETLSPAEFSARFGQ